MRPIVVTACTNRKREAPSGELAARSLPQGDMHSVCAEWVARLASASGPRFSLSDLYCGRAFREAEAASHAVGGELLVVSAGLGLVSATAAAPSYSLTLARESVDCVLKRTSSG